MGHLIATTNFEKDSDKVLTSSHLLAKALGHQLTVLHSLEYHPGLIEMMRASSADILKYQKDETWQQQYDVHSLEKISEQLKRCGMKKEDVFFEIIGGDMPIDLKNYLKGIDCEAVAMGGTHHGEVYRFFYGSFVEKTLFNAQANSCIIKEELKSVPKKLGLLLMGHHSAPKATQKAIEYAKALQAEVSVIALSPVTIFDVNEASFFEELKAGHNLANYVEKQQQKAQENLQQVVSTLEREGVGIAGQEIFSAQEDPLTRLEEHMQKEEVELNFLEVNHHFKKSFAVGALSYEILKHIPHNFYVLAH